MTSFQNSGKASTRKLLSNSALYYALAVILFIYLIQGSVPFRHYDSVFVFKVELLFVVLYFSVHKGINYHPEKSYVWLNLGLILWVACCISLFLFKSFDEIEYNKAYLYKAFHGVFVYFAILVFGLASDTAKLNSAVFETKRNVLNKLVFLLLCLSTFFIALTSGSNVVQNSNMVFKYEILFVLACIFLPKTIPDFGRYFNTNPLVVIVFTLWVLSVTISFVFSPYDINTKSFVYERFDQTIMHSVFFIFASEFLRKTNIDKQILPLMLPASVVVISVVFAVSWFRLAPDIDVDWFLNPPINGHIRYVGYIATAAVCALLPFTLSPDNLKLRSIWLLMFLLVSMALLCWTGGRAAAGSVMIVFVGLVMYLGVAKSLRKIDFFLTASMLVLAFIVAEQMSVFDWNGFARLWVNTQNVGSSNLNEVTTGRVSFWDTSIESLKGNFIFGLGPQGYYFMPNRAWGLHPHNMFIQFVVEWGIIGAALFIGLMVIFAFKIAVVVRNTSSRLSIVFLSGVAIVVGLTIHGLVDGTYYHGQPSYYIALALSLCASEMTNQSNEIK